MIRDGRDGRRSETQGLLAKVRAGRDGDERGRRPSDGRPESERRAARRRLSVPASAPHPHPRGLVALRSELSEEGRTQLAAAAAAAAGGSKGKQTDRVWNGRRKKKKRDIRETGCRGVVGGRVKGGEEGQKDQSDPLTGHLSG